MTTTQKFILAPLLTVTVLGGGALIGYAQLSRAAQDQGIQGRWGMGHGMMMGHRGVGTSGIHGTITKIDGTTLTVQGMNGTTYTVDMGDADVHTFTDEGGFKEGTWQDLSVGDRVGVRGTLDDTSVKATDVMTGDHPHMGRHPGFRDGAMGEVKAIDGTTLTVETPRGDTVTINAGDAHVSRVVSGSLGDIKVGDTINVHGDRDGSTVTATHIMDDVPRLHDDR